jgi:hypothetical protein
MSKDKIDHHEDSVGTKKKRGCANHCKRFWWIYLIVSIAVILLVVLLIIFVAVPKIAQHKVNESDLEIDSIVISQTHPNSYQLTVNSTIKTDGSISAKIDGFEASMYLEDTEDQTPFTTINFPKTTAAKEQHVSVSQHIDISNLAAFTQFNTWLLANETLRLTVTGDTHVHVKGLSKAYGVNYKKTVELKGLNNFAGLNVTAAQINPLATSNNFRGFVDIPNPSVLTIEIGDTTFFNYLDGRDIGTVYMDDLILRPGINNISIHADISQAPVLTKIVQRPFCESGLIDFQMQGKNVTDSDGAEVTYFSHALASANQTVTINIGQALRAASVPVRCAGDS